MDRGNVVGLAEMVAFRRRSMAPNSNEIHARFEITLESIELDVTGWLRETILPRIGRFARKFTTHRLTNGNDGTAAAIR
jgi:hypothetical protein